MFLAQSINQIIIRSESSLSNDFLLSHVSLSCPLWKFQWILKIIEAVKAVRDGMRVPDASIQFRVPIRTLYRWLKKLIPDCRGGKKPVFTPYEEGLFVTVTLGFEGFGLPLTRKKFSNMVHAEAKRNREFSVFIFDFKSKNSNFKSNQIQLLLF